MHVQKRTLVKDCRLWMGLGRRPCDKRRWCQQIFGPKTAPLSSSHSSCKPTGSRCAEPFSAREAPSLMLIGPACWTPYIRPPPLFTMAQMTRREKPPIPVPVRCVVRVLSERFGKNKKLAEKSVCGFRCQAIPTWHGHHLPKACRVDQFRTLGLARQALPTCSYMSSSPESSPFRFERGISVEASADKRRSSGGVDSGLA